MRRETLPPRPDWQESFRAHVEGWRDVVMPLLDSDERSMAQGLLADVETLTTSSPRSCTVMSAPRTCWYATADSWV